MKKMIVLAVALLLLVGSVTAAKSYGGNPFAALQEQVDDLQSQIDSWESTPAWWDANGNGVCDPEEDTNADGSCDYDDWENWVESFFDVMVGPLEARIASLEAEVIALEKRVADEESCTGCGGEPTLGCCQGATCTDDTTWYDCSLTFSTWYSGEACTEVPACNGACVPSLEICDGLDNDCNPETPDGSADPVIGNACDGGDADLCLEGTVVCAAGMLVCSDNTGDNVEVCNGVDDNCDGVIDEGCGCVDGATRACYSGPAGTANVGECREGTQLCAAGVWDVCTGEVLPAVETCDFLDNNCDGQVDEDCFIDCNDDNPCTDDMLVDGSCVYANNHNPCEDGSACTTQDVCDMGICIGGAALSCNDGRSCTMDACDPMAGCVFIADDAACDDGIFCNGAEICDVGMGCVSGTPPCDPGDVCLEISHTCTSGDTCGDGLCTSGETANSCPIDCAAVCGDGFCTHSENPLSCGADCLSECGDTYCSNGEDMMNCPADCPPLSLGDACASSMECASGYCVDIGVMGGVCCDTYCDGPCETCTSLLNPGTCTPLPEGTDCGDGMICDDVGICFLP